MRERRESERLIKAMRIARGEHETTDALQFGMRHDERHQALADAAVTRFLDDEDVSEPREAGAVTDHARERELATAFVDAEANRMLDRALDEFAPDAGHPVRFAAKKIVDQVRI